jgi:hypothetical protein
VVLFASWLSSSLVILQDLVKAAEMEMREKTSDKERNIHVCIAKAFLERHRLGIFFLGSVPGACGMGGSARTEWLGWDRMGMGIWVSGYILHLQRVGERHFGEGWIEGGEGMEG